VLLEAESLTVSARLGNGDVAVLRDVSFALDRGRILGLVGESGAGKSMIGRIVARLLPPSFRVAEGWMRFADHDLLAASPAEHRSLLGDRIAFIPQEPLSALNPVLTIAQQFGEHLARLGVPARLRRAKNAADLAGGPVRGPRALPHCRPVPVLRGGGPRRPLAPGFPRHPPPRA